MSHHWQVVFAGEFCITHSSTNPKGLQLVIDNNSGTYAPPTSKLPALRDLIAFNFPGLEVNVMAADDPALKVRVMSGFGSLAADFAVSTLFSINIWQPHI